MAESNNNVVTDFMKWHYTAQFRCQHTAQVFGAACLGKTGAIAPAIVVTPTCLQVTSLVLYQKVHRNDSEKILCMLSGSLQRHCICLPVHAALRVSNGRRQLVPAESLVLWNQTGKADPEQRF